MTQLIDLKEGSNELKVSIHTLRSRIYQRKLAYVKLRRRVLLKREDLENFIQKNLVKAK